MFFLNIHVVIQSKRDCYYHSNAVCSTCGQVYKSVTGLRDHEVRKHAAPARYTCSMCPRVFQSYTLLIIHEHKHSNVCIFSYKSKAGFDYHNAPEPIYQRLIIYMLLHINYDYYELSGSVTPGNLSGELSLNPLVIIQNL